MTAPVIRRRTLVRLPADPARTDVKLGQRAPYEGEWVERPEYLPVSHMPVTAAGRALMAKLTQKHDGPYAEAPLLHSAIANDIEAIEREAHEQERERIRTAALAARKRWGAEGLPASLEAILDAEAER